MGLTLSQRNKSQEVQHLNLIVKYVYLFLLILPF